VHFNIDLDDETGLRLNGLAGADRIAGLQPEDRQKNAQWTLHRR
jgi:hypothetical protein